MAKELNTKRNERKLEEKRDRIAIAAAAAISVIALIFIGTILGVVQVKFMGFRDAEDDLAEAMLANETLRVSLVSVYDEMVEKTHEDDFISDKFEKIKVGSETFTGRKLNFAKIDNLLTDNAKKKMRYFMADYCDQSEHCYFYNDGQNDKNHYAHRIDESVFARRIGENEPYFSVDFSDMYKAILSSKASSIAGTDEYIVFVLDQGTWKIDDFTIY